MELKNFVLFPRFCVSLFCTAVFIREESSGEGGGWICSKMIRLHLMLLSF
jgi:hypothetical protein